VTKFLKNLELNFSAPLARCCARFFAAFIIFTLVTLQVAQAGVDHGVGRTRSCNIGNNGNVTVEGLDWNPTSGGEDIEFVLTNPVCFSFAITSYASVKAAIALMNYACGTGSGVPRVTPTPFMDVYEIGKATVRGSPTPQCRAAIFGATASLTTALGLLSATYIAAKNVFENSQICGAEWMAPSATTFNFSIPSYKQTVQNQINSWVRSGQTDKLKLTNKTFREWYYGGVEVVDDPDDGSACLDVTQPKVNGEYPRQAYYLKGSDIGNYNCKKYNLQSGQNDPLDNKPVTDKQRLKELNSAYQCCLNRSSNYICIQYDVGNAGASAVGVSQATDLAADGINAGANANINTAGAFSDIHRLFCRAGTRCEIQGIYFTSKFRDNDRMICAESYSLCPYNFSLGGGSEYCDYYRDGIWDDGRWRMITAEQISLGQCASNSEIRNADCTYNAKAGKCRNYCQYLTHCTRTSTLFPYVSGITSPYFSEACLNFEGDSQNKVAVNTGFILGSQRHFSAPIAQCVKETLENVFYNRAGHSQCLSAEEQPSAGGICPSGLYAGDGGFFNFKKGNPVKQKSFFTTIQDNLQLAVKLTLTFSIMLYGMNLLLWKTDIRQKKDILIYILKIALVAYFATGDAWQSMFFNGVYNASSEFSRMVFKIQTGDTENKRDGCQFGRIYLTDGTEVSSGRTYPPGKEYLAMWDTLDCKIMRYLGFGPEVSAANIAMLILASFFTGPIGIYFALSVLIFGLLLIAATLRALHIFLSSAISIIIMVFVSPIVIPLALFEKTKGIFDGWLKELISFCLQPMILFAYIAIFLMVMDRTLIGSAEFNGPGPFKTINCEKKCVNVADGSIVPYVDGVMPECDQIGQHIIDPLNDSAACLLDFNGFGSFPGFEIIGVTIPVLINIFESHTKERILTILKAALVMYLIYTFMDEIPGITSALIGGTKLPAGKADGIAMWKKGVGAARGIQKRLARGALKGAKKGVGKARDGIRAMSSKGKKEEEIPTGGGSDKTESSSSGGGSDKGASSDSSSSDSTTQDVSGSDTGESGA